MQVSATRVSVGWCRARGGDVARGGAGVEAAVVLAVAVMAPMTRTESTGPYSMVSGSSSAPTGPDLEDDRARLTGFTATQASRRMGQAGEPAGVTAAGSS
jgi:hypothetical protein